jgi:hypothetical protein
MNQLDQSSQLPEWVLSAISRSRAASLINRAAAAPAHVTTGARPRQDNDR